MNKPNQTEYFLEDVIEKNSENPRKFIIPTADEIDNLKVGNSVRLIFTMQTPQDDGCSAERMWLTITTIKDNKFSGQLENTPHYLKSIKCGDIIDFKKENIATVIVKGTAKFDEQQLVFISKRAVENREINWIVRADDLCGENDSGWQLFYGDEDDEYLDDPSMIVRLTIEQVLLFEPLLETPFIDRGYAYEYVDEIKMFVEADDWVAPEDINE